MPETPQLPGEPIDPRDLQVPGDSIGNQVDRRAQQILNRKKSGLN